MFKHRPIENAGVELPVLTAGIDVGWQIGQKSMVESAPNEVDANCAPPSDLVACTTWHQVIRANFSPREIGMLFGTATSYPEYATSYARIKSRYERLQGAFSAERLPARAVSVN